jgi:hypothetical protein
MEGEMNLCECYPSKCTSLKEMKVVVKNRGDARRTREDSRKNESSKRETNLNINGRRSEGAYPQ